MNKTDWLETLVKKYSLPKEEQKEKEEYYQKHN